MKDPADKLTLNNPARIHSYYTVRLKFTIIPKIYIFDDDYALVASANATDSGMRHNLECGLSTTDRSVVESLATSLIPNPLMDTDGRREDTGRGVRK